MYEGVSRVAGLKGTEGMVLGQPNPLETRSMIIIQQITALLAYYLHLNSFVILPLPLTGEFWVL